jgi:hypothetical protein
LAVLDFDPHLGIRNLFDANDGIHHYSQQNHPSNHKSKPCQSPGRQGFTKEPPASKGQQHSGNPHRQGKDDDQFSAPQQQGKDDQRQAVDDQSDDKPSQRFVSAHHLKARSPMISRVAAIRSNSQSPVNGMRHPCIAVLLTSPIANHYYHCCTTVAV